MYTSQTKRQLMDYHHCHKTCNTCHVKKRVRHMMYKFHKTYMFHDLVQCVTETVHDITVNVNGFVWCPVVHSFSVK
jgi:hypothetical protein